MEMLMSFGKPFQKASRTEYAWKFILLFFFLELSLVSLSYARNKELNAKSVNRFPILSRTEAFLGETLRFKITFKFFYPAGAVEYYPVSEKVATLLSRVPTVEVDEGLTATVLKTVCTPTEVLVRMGQGSFQVKGGLILCEFEVVVADWMPESEPQVRLKFELIDFVAAKLGATGPESNAEVHINIKVWESAASKREAERKATLEKLRKEEEARLARIEKRNQFLKWGSIVLLILLILITTLWLLRKWLWPTLRVEMDAGEYRQFPRSVRAQHAEQSIEPGTILRTIWAKSFWGERQRIKVETFIARDRSEEDYFRDLDVLISIGSSVPRGTYLADEPNGAVIIKVEG